MKKMLMLAAVLSLAACQKNADNTPATDSVPAMAPADTSAMMSHDSSMMMGTDSTMADTTAKDSSSQM